MRLPSETATHFLYIVWATSARTRNRPTKRRSGTTLLKELYKYLTSYFNRSGTSDITIVRRYPTPCGYVGELYVDGRQLAVTCDNFIDGQELFKHVLTVGYEGWQRVLRTETYLISNGDFTARVPYNVCLVGSMEPSTNKATLSKLMDRVQGKEHLRLTVLNRLLIES